MKNKPYAFLGHYLIGNGLITEKQLDEAIRLQRESTVLVGTIALDRGFLDKNQLNYLIKRQIQVDEQIGSLAIQEGFMTEDQLETVLAIQGRNHQHLGESLVRMGTISNQTLNEALTDFESQIAAQEKYIRDDIGHLPMAKELLITLDVTLRFFYRLGYALHVVGRCDASPDYVEHLFCSEQHFKKENARYMGVGMNSMLVDSIAQGPRIRERFDRPSSNALENMSQLMFNLNYIVCKRMKKLGIRVKHGAAFMETLTGDRIDGVCVEMESVTGPMVFTYGVRPHFPAQTEPYTFSVAL